MNEKHAIIVRITKEQVMQCFVQNWSGNEDVYCFQSYIDDQQIPSDAVITGVVYDISYDGWLVRMEHPSFPLIDPRYAVPIQYAHFERILLRSIFEEVS